METRLLRQQTKPASGPSAEDPQGLEEPGHLRPSAASEAQAAPTSRGKLPGRGGLWSQPPPCSLASHLSIFALGGPGPGAAGQGARACPLWPWPRLALLARAPPPTCPCSAVGAGEVVDDLCLGLCPGPPGQVALIRVPLLSDGPSGACGRGLGGQREPPPRGPGGCLTSLAFACPAPIPPPWAAPFTTSGYRTLHEFRSQWNYFRILVNRKLGVFHKLSITAVWWAEPGPGP